MSKWRMTDCISILCGSGVDSGRDGVSAAVRVLEVCRKLVEADAVASPGSSSAAQKLGGECSGN